MSYRSFKNISKVCEKFNLDYFEKEFVKEEKFSTNEYFLNNLLNNFKRVGTFNSENAICERIISPIILEVADKNKLPVFSHIQFNVDKNLGLTGEPDFLLAPAVPGGYEFTTPVVCFAEAKKDKFDLGWGQVAAEMVAAQIKNENKKVVVYGIVSNGKEWHFGMLKNNDLTVDPNSCIAPKHIDEVLNSINWIFCEARKNVKILNKK